MILAAALLLGLMAATPAAADFVLSNLRFTLYHEVGHAVIDQMRVPLFGSGETAADGFGLMVADRLHSETEMREIITDMTRLGRTEAAREIFDPWSEYMPGAQRMSRAICLWFGLKPTERGDHARALGMPPQEEWACIENARALRSAWTPILDDLRPDGTGGVSLRVAATGKALRLLAPDIARLNKEIALPRPTPVTIENCGEDNAYYYQYDDRIVICAELVTGLRRDALR